MIVRERPNSFVMIEQDNHAHVSGEIMTQWKDSLFPGLHLRQSVEHAIYRHDYGWKPFDRQPFWNDQKQAPYTFIDFPAVPKTVLYKHGIDEVENEDTYAAMLCSEHYKQFMKNDTGESAQTFVQQEEQRQQRIVKMLGGCNEKLFNNHFSLLQLGDSLSLYACLNEPGVDKEDEHPFFKEGIPIPNKLDGWNHDKLAVSWKDDRTIVLDPFPFEKTVSFHLQQKTITKQAIAEHGLMDSYEDAPFEKVYLRLMPMRSL
ncbi:DUF3891 family protein [Lentibacillus lipolyticus]|nr:DUF3891 family protein [Lentibacillus lipolyticus]